jgi:hypothetical protein
MENVNSEFKEMIGKKVVAIEKPDLATDDILIISFDDGSSCKLKASVKYFDVEDLQITIGEV